MFLCLRQIWRPEKLLRKRFIAHELQHDWIDGTHDEQTNPWSTLVYNPTTILMFFVLVTLFLSIPILVDMF